MQFYTKLFRKNKMNKKETEEYIEIGNGIYRDEKRNICLLSEDRKYLLRVSENFRTLFAIYQARFAIVLLLAYLGIYYYNSLYGIVAAIVFMIVIYVLYHKVMIPGLDPVKKYKEPLPKTNILKRYRNKEDFTLIRNVFFSFLISGIFLYDRLFELNTFVLVKNVGPNDLLISNILTLGMIIVFAAYGCFNLFCFAVKKCR